MKKDGFVKSDSQPEIRWTQIALPEGVRLDDVVYGDGQFIAAKYSTDIGFRSVDGVTWEAIEFPFRQSSRRLTYGDGIFVATSRTHLSTAACFSHNGADWLVADTNPPGRWTWGAAAYGNNRFMTRTNGDRLVSVTEDGRNWETCRDGTIPGINVADRHLTFGNGVFVQFQMHRGSTVWASANGVDWQVYTTPYEGEFGGVGFGNGTFVALDESSPRGLISENGSDWTETTLPCAGNWHPTCFGRGCFVALSRVGSTALVSRDGMNWAESDLGCDDAVSWSRLAYGAGTFVAGNKEGVALLGRLV